MRPGHSLERRHFIEANGPPPPATDTTAIYSQPQLSSVNWTTGQKYRGTPQLSILTMTSSTLLRCSVVKLREREGQRVDLGRSLKGHL